MAGEPAPLASVKAAVMKSAAGAAAQAPASQAVPMHQQAIAQDLSVMADQAKGYTQGVNIGNAEQAANRNAQAGRLAQEAAQAAQERANSLELQRMDLEARKARMTQDAASAQLRLVESKGETEAVDEEALYQARKNSVLAFAARNRDENFALDLEDIVASSDSYESAVSLLDNWAAQGKITSNAPAMRAYLRQVFQKAAAGKNPNLGALKKDTAKPGYKAPDAAAPKRSGGGGFNLADVRTYPDLNPLW